MNRLTYQSGGFETFNRAVPPVVKAILIINVAVFLLQFVIEYAFDRDFLTEWLGLHPVTAVEHLQVWRFLTYAYLHSLDNPFHIIWNLLLLWWFGCELARYFAARRFLVFYHLAVLIGGVAQVTANYVKNATEVSTIGASAGVYGIFAVYAILFPNRHILAFFLFPIRMKYFILGIVAVDLISGTRMLSTGSAHFAHLGGAAAGAAFYFLHGRVEGFLHRLEHRAEAREVERDENTRAEVDRLLEKIRQEGMHKLTPKEKRFLNNASKLYQKDD
jgi:membrane associated rhomboid family serine protease